VLSIALAMLLILPLCGWMFQCGCGFLWSSYEKCNIHQPGVPHCPWCVERNSVLMALPFFLIVGAQVTVIYLVNKKYAPPFLILLMLGLLTFFVIAVVAGYWFKVMDNYPYFFMK